MFLKTFNVCRRLLALQHYSSYICGLSEIMQDLMTGQ